MAEKHLIKFSTIMHFFQKNEESFKNGEDLFESGHVSDIVFDESVKTLKGRVRGTDKHYQVTVTFTPEWEIQEGRCTCGRGQSRCPHVASLLVFGYYNITDTDDQEEVMTIGKLFPSKPYRATSRDLTTEEIEELASKLSICDGAVGLSWLLAKDNPWEAPLVVEIQDIIYSPEYQDSENKLEFFEAAAELTQATIEKVASETLGQHKNSKWLLARQHRLTASNFGMVLAACHRNSFPPSLFKRLVGAYHMDHVKAIQWGRDNEKSAIKELEKALHVKVEPTGLWLDKCGYLGASPDGLIRDDAIVEVKCPYKYREQSLSEGIRQNHDYIVRADDSGNVSVNKQHDYFKQIQGQLAVTDRSLCYLCVWTPKEKIIVEIEKEDFSEEYSVLKRFYIEQYLQFITRVG